MLPASDGWEPLHPLSPMLRAVRVGWLLVVIAAQNLADGSDVPAGIVAGVIAGGVVLAALYSYVAWRSTGFRVRGQELELQSGVLFRSRRHVPLARLETVDIRRPLFARIFSLAEVRVEVVSQGDSEVKLQYLADARAVEVRERLIRLGNAQHPTTAAGGDASADADAGTALAAPPEIKGILRVPTREIVIAYGIAPLALLVAFSVATFLAIALADSPRDDEGGGVLGGIVVVAVTMLTSLLPLVSRLDKLVNFRLGESAGALHVERGLLNQLTQRINVGRIQAVRFEEPALWRLFGRGRLQVDVAGYRGGGQQQDSETAILLPIGPVDVIQYLLARIPGGIGTEHVEFVPAPPAARRRSPLRWRHFEVACTDEHLVVRSGWLRRRTDIVRHAKLQSVRVSDGPWQRPLRLATLHLDTAGGRIKAKARHRGTDEALALALRSRALGL